MLKMNKALPLVVALALALMVITTASAEVLTVSTPIGGAAYYPGDYLVVSGVTAPGASVSVKLYNPNGVLVAFGTATSDSTTGRFSLSLCRLPTPPGPDNKWPYGTYVVEVFSAGETVKVSVELKARGGVITVKVVDENGEPIQGATVEIVDTGLTAITRVDGSATIDVAPGTYDIKIYKSGYFKVLLEDKVVAPGTTLNLGTITLMSLEGKVAQLEALLKQLSDKIAELESQSKDVSTLKNDVSNLKNDVSTLKNDVSNLKNQLAIISTLQSITQNLQSAIQGLTSTTQSLSNTVNNLGGTVSGMQMLSYAGIIVGIIGVVLAVVAIAYVARKVKA